ncbi:MAG: VWA domain-containing protein, partial [Planctomycetia bacterium]
MESSNVSIALSPVVAWWFVAATAVGLVVFAQWIYAPGTPRRRLLLGLRLAAVALTVFALLRPSIVFTKKIEQSSTLVVMVDKSKSMLLKDEWNGQSRWEAVQTVLKDADPSFQRLAEKVQIRRFEFSRKAVEAVTPEDPAGDQTGIGEALQEILQRTAGERLSGVLLLTDGANTTGVAPITVARQLVGQRTPIHAFGFGQETANDQMKDLAARSITTSPTVFKKNKALVRAEFSTSGLPDRRPIPVRMLFDGVEAAAGVFETDVASGRGLIDLSAAPTRAGDVKVTIEAAAQPGEMLPTNNAVSTYVTVLDGGLSVLQIEGKYRFWEPKFIRWALDQSPDVELTQLFLLDDGDKLPADALKPGSFDVVVIGDCPASRFTGDELNKLRDLVTMNGVGLMMVGGYESFGPGGWGNTPIADLLPVTVRANDPQRTQPLKME